MFQEPLECFSLFLVYSAKMENLCSQDLFFSWFYVVWSDGTQYSPLLQFVFGPALVFSIRRLSFAWDLFKPSELSSTVDGLGIIVGSSRARVSHNHSILFPSRVSTHRSHSGLGGQDGVIVTDSGSAGSNNNTQTI